MAYIDIDIDNIIGGLSESERKELFEELKDEFDDENLLQELHNAYTNYGLTDMLELIKDKGYKNGLYFNFGSK